MAKSFKGYQFTKEINGTKYTFKYPGRRRASEITDDCKDNNGNIVMKDFYQKLYDEVIVDPKVSFDYFDEFIDDHDEVAKIAANCVGGRFPRNDDADKAPV